MASINIVLGQSGNGKSHSIQGLNSEETVIFNITNKRLPFKGSMGKYNKDKKNLFHITDYNQAIMMLENISEKGSHIKVVVIDDAIYLMRNDFANALTAKGGGSSKFDLYNQIAVNFKNLMETCEGLRDDLNIFMMFHPEDVNNDESITSMKVATFGKLTDRICRPEELVDVLLVCKPRISDDGVIEYGFYTHKCYDKKTGIEIPAKTPQGMFEEDFIPNNLGYVLTKINEFYG